MNREIKFRGKDLATGKWVYGYYYCECGNTYIIEDRQKVRMTMRNIPFLVNPDTVGQFTNLRDCNGKDIYEGDILADYSCSPFPFVVEWDNEMGEYLVECPITYDCESLCRVILTTEIIGNIYDNPDLIKWK